MDYRILVAVAFVLVSYTEVTAENTPNCPMLYQRYSASHSFCQPKNTSCQIVKQGIGNKKQEILDLHNHYRTIMAKQLEGNRNWPPAADMMELEWDEELAKIAQHRADSCIYAHDANEARKVLRFDVGQNIADIYDQQSIATKQDWAYAIKAWFGEIDLLEPSKLCGDRELHKIGHFTALVWGKTFKVGCGYTQFKHGDVYDELYYCDYGPGGNDNNVCIYEEGPACSKCPGKTTCDQEKGLCKRISENAKPIREVDHQQYLFNCNFDNPSEDCKFETSGAPQWKRFRTLTEDYVETVLQPGQNSTIVFSNKIKIPPNPENAFCIGWRYRKGPNKAKDEANNLAKVFVHPVVPGAEAYNLLTYDLKINSLAFAQDGATFHWTFPTEVKVSFAVPEEATPQYFNLHSVFSYLGRCKFG